MKNILRGGIHHILEGYYRVSVVDGLTGETVWEMPEEKKNLILNQGLDAVYSNNYAELLKYAVAGTGTRLNYIDPVGSMLSQTGTTVTLQPTGSGGGLNHLTQSFGNYTTALQVGDVIQYTTGSGGTTLVNVTAVSDLTATVDTSLTISPSQSFTIWKTSQTLLQNESRRAGTGITGTSYLVGTGNCGSSSATGQINLYRTYDFVTESVLRTYGEIGVSWSATTSSANIFSRIALPSTVNVDVGQRLRVFYKLNLTLGPSSGSNRPNVTISGWPVSPSTNTNGTESIQNLLISYVDINGNSTGQAALDPNSSGADCQAWVSTSSASLAAWGTGVDRSGVSPTAATANTTKNAYTNGSYTCDKVATISAASFTATTLRSMGLGYAQVTAPYTSGTNAYAFVFDQNQTKTNTQTLTLSWRWTWGRTLTN